MDDVGSSVAAGTYSSKAEFLDRVIRPFNTRLSSPLVPSVHALYADGDTVIAYFEASATARERRALEEYDLDADTVRARPSDVVENYEQ